MGSSDFQIKAIAEWKCLIPSAMSTEGYEETLGVMKGAKLI